MTNNRLRRDFKTMPVDQWVTRGSGPPSSSIGCYPYMFYNVRIIFIPTESTGLLLAKTG